MTRTAFNPQRLRIARQRAGYSITDFARAIGLTARQVSNYEHGTSEPSAASIAKIVDTLGFPEAFFFSESLVELVEANATFRSLRRTTATQRNQVLAVGSIAMDLNRWVEARFDLPSVDIPDLSEHVNQPEMAAVELRSMWKLGEQPLANTIALLETHGVRVFSLVEDLREVNAFSVWVDERPFVFLNTTKSGEASRFDAMHELGHLALHRTDRDPRDAEAEANRFAAAMLMPEADVKAVTPQYVGLDSLIKLKRRWGVSVAALAHRLNEIGIIGPWPYRNLCIAINQQGFRTREPNPIDRESSRVLAKVLAQLRSENVSLSDIAADLRVPREELEKLVFGLAFVGLSGQGDGVPGSGRRGPLRLV